MRRIDLGRDRNVKGGNKFEVGQEGQNVYARNARQVEKAAGVVRR